MSPAADEWELIPGAGTFDRRVYLVAKGARGRLAPHPQHAHGDEHHRRSPRREREELPTHRRERTARLLLALNLPLRFAPYLSLPLLGPRFDLLPILAGVYAPLHFGQ